jgi:hypothetical protein
MVPGPVRGEDNSIHSNVQLMYANMMHNMMHNMDSMIDIVVFVLLIIKSPPR